MLKPTGYYVLVRMEEVEQTTESGIIIATNKEHEREQGGHDVGVILAVGPTSYMGFEGIDDSLPVQQRMEQYGVKIGDKVEFTRYDGKVPSNPELKDCRLIKDEMILGAYE